jgi:hypothetical protein
MLIVECISVVIFKSCVIVANFNDNIEFHYLFYNNRNEAGLDLLVSRTPLYKNIYTLVLYYIAQ